MPLIGNMDAAVMDNLAPGFSPGAYWEEVQPSDEVLEENGLIVNEEVFHEHMVNEGEEMKVPKRNFPEQFE